MTTNQLTHVRSARNPDTRATCGASLVTGNVCIIDRGTWAPRHNEITCEACRKDLGLLPLKPGLPAIGSKWQYRYRSGSNQDTFYVVVAGPDRKSVV